jgi:hypothetical protein
MQHAMAEDTPPPLYKAGKKFIQEVCKVFLFLARGVNGGLLPTSRIQCPGVLTGKPNGTNDVTM